MFEALREKIQTVSTSLKGLQPQKRRLTSERTDFVDVHCGAELLNHYQNCWEEINKNKELSVAQAKIVSAQLNNLTHTVNRRSDAVANFTSELRSLPAVAASLDNILVEFSTIERLCQAVETGLDALQQLHLTAQLRFRKSQKSQELIAMRNVKISSFIEIRDKMELEHRKKLREKEIRLQVQKVEKVKVLQEAFEDDLAYYKRTGKVKKMEEEICGDKLAKLKDNSYPDLLTGDTKEFEQFLSDVPQSSAHVVDSVLNDSDASD